MKLNGLMAKVDCENFIIPAMFREADEQDELAALSRSDIQRSKTLCLRTKYSPITRSVFHVVLTRCIDKYELADSAISYGLESQSAPERQPRTKNFVYFLTTTPCYFVIAYKLGYIRVTLFREKDTDQEHNCCTEGVGVEIKQFVKDSIDWAIYICKNKKDPILEFIDTSIFGDTSAPKPLATPCLDDYFSVGYLNVWFLENKVGLHRFLSHMSQRL